MGKLEPVAMHSRTGPFIGLDASLPTQPQIKYRP